MADNLFGRAAELGFYFLFALFPTLFSASSILSLAARSATKFYDSLLQYLALVMPTDALGSVLKVFNETTNASSSGKFTFGLIAAIWSASVGVSAVQDTLNAVYKVKESRSYVRARLSAIGLTLILMVTITLGLCSMLGADFFATIAKHKIHPAPVAMAAIIVVRLVGWTLATALLSLSFSAIYYWAPDVKKRKWHWVTVGGLVGIAAWVAVSLGLRIYLHFFNNYSVTYGSLGAVIILLTWFYLTGLMILIGAEINSEIEAAVAERHLATGTLADHPSAA